MSPVSLAGKSFGRLPDKRNLTCRKCGRSFREFGLRKIPDNEDEIKIICPYCGYQIRKMKNSEIVTFKKTASAEE